MKLNESVVMNDIKKSLEDEYYEMEKCVWCGEEYEKSELKKDVGLGYLCNTCIKAIESRGEELEFEEDEY